MNINKDTKLSDLLTAYPWLKAELSTVNEKFRMLNTPMGKVMLRTATIGEMSRRSGTDEAELIEKLTKINKSPQ